jgi:hypothetical protein
VLIVNTWQVRHGEKTDLNDILRQSGPEGPALLRQRISADAIKQVRATATDSWPRHAHRQRRGRDTIHVAPPRPHLKFRDQKPPKHVALRAQLSVRTAMSTWGGNRSFAQLRGSRIVNSL